MSWKAHYSQIIKKANRILHLIRRTFGQSPSLSARKRLQLCRSQMTYCSPIWRPLLTKDIIALETVPRRATKFILNSYDTDYKDRVIKFQLLPLMMVYELADIIIWFFTKSLKQPNDSFNITSYVEFCCGKTRSNSKRKLKHTNIPTSNTQRHLFFNRIVRLWNSLPQIDLGQTYHTIKQKVKYIFLDHFMLNFEPSNPCPYHYTCPCSNCIISSTTYYSFSGIQVWLASSGQSFKIAHPIITVQFHLISSAEYITTNYLFCKVW